MITFSPSTASDTSIVPCRSSGIACFAFSSRLLNTRSSWLRSENTYSFSGVSQMVTFMWSSFRYSSTALFSSAVSSSSSGRASGIFAKFENSEAM